LSLEKVVGELPFLFIEYQT